MQRASEAEIRRRKNQQIEKSTLFLSFFAACIPIFNGIYFWHMGGVVASIARDQTKVRLMYRVFGCVLLLLPILMLSIYPSVRSMFWQTSTLVMWVIYLVPAFLIARKHTSILRDLKELEAL
jgi:uncharacterized membrane protein